MEEELEESALIALESSIIAELVSIIMELLDASVSVSVVTEAVPLHAARARRESDTAERATLFIQNEVKNKKSGHYSMH